MMNTTSENAAQLESQYGYAQYMYAKNNAAAMNIQSVNPWQWQDNFGYAQAVEIKNVQGTLYCAGQAAMDASGNPLEGSMAEQLQLSLQNLETVIEKAGYLPAHIVRLNIFTTSIPAFFATYATLMDWLRLNQVTPSCTLVQVEALAFPALTIEVEATAVR